MNLDLTQLVAIAAALGWASGLRLYAVVFLTGLAGALGWVELPGGLHILQSPWLLGASGVLLFVEFFVDKIPGLDSVWDALHTVIRIPAGAALAAAAFGGDEATWTTAAALLGGGLAATSHLAKATTRAAANTSPEPFSNIALSLLGDGLVPFVLWLSWAHPLLFFVTLGVALRGHAGDDLDPGAIPPPRCQRGGLALSSADASRSPERGDPMSALPSTVTLVDVGPRDGLQNEKQAVDSGVKIELVHRLQAAGLKEIEVTSFVSPKWVPQMGDNAAVMAGIVRKPGVRYSVLVPNMKGLDAALSAPRPQWPDEVVVFAAASEAFSRRNINCSIAESVERFRPVVDAAKAKGIKVRAAISVALGCPYQGEVSADEVEHVVRLMKEIGVDHCGIADTIGVGTPKKVQAAMERALRHFPIEEVSGHFHDTYAQGVGNVYAALEVGIATFDASIAGLGGCPYAKGATGNVATEDVVFMLHGLGIETGISLDGAGRRGGLHLRRARQEAGVALGERAACQAGSGGGEGSPPSSTRQAARGAPDCAAGSCRGTRSARAAANARSARRPRDGPAAAASAGRPAARSALAIHSAASGVAMPTSPACDARSAAATLATAASTSPAHAASQACRAWSGTSCSRKASRSQRAISPAHCTAVGSGRSALPAVSISSQPRSRFSEASVRASASLVSIRAPVARP